MWKKFKRRNRVQKPVQIYTAKTKRYQIFGVNQLLITKLPYLLVATLRIVKEPSLTPLNMTILK